MCRWGAAVPGGRIEKHSENWMLGLFESTSLQIKQGIEALCIFVGMKVGYSGKYSFISSR